MRTRESVTIRRAGRRDTVALERLSGLDSARPLQGEVLLAEVDGTAWAAIEVATGRAVADPFRPSAEILELLRLRAARLGGHGRAARGRRPLLRRYATKLEY